MREVKMVVVIETRSNANDRQTATFSGLSLFDLSIAANALGYSTGTVDPSIGKGIVLRNCFRSPLVFVGAEEGGLCVVLDKTDILNNLKEVLWVARLRKAERELRSKGYNLTEYRRLEGGGISIVAEKGGKWVMRLSIFTEVREVGVG